MSRFATAVTGAAAILSTAQGFAEQQNPAGVTFSHPHRIRYDNRSLIIDGSPCLHLFGCAALLPVPARSCGRIACRS